MKHLNLLASTSGDPKRVTKVTQEWTNADGPKVYNLTVAELPSYAVGPDGVLAHNVGACALRKKLGLTIGDGMDAHHLVPQEALSEFAELMRRAERGGFEIHGARNGFAVERGLHRQLHGGGYNQMVLDELRRLEEYAGNLTDLQVASRLNSIAGSMRVFMQTLEIVE